MTDTVVIKEPVNEPTLEESAIELGILNKDGNESVEASDRPEWLPEKFTSAEEMAKAYSELEAKQSQPNEDTQEAPAVEEEAREVAEAAGVDFDALSAEYAANDGLTDESYASLEEAGIPRAIVDQFIAGQVASASQSRDSVLSEAGGQEQYDEMTAWAGDTFSDEEIDAFNQTVEGGSLPAMRMAVAGLKARFEQDRGSEPTRMIGGESEKGGSAYRSIAELTADMSSARYETDPAFRADVQDKLARSDIM